MAEYAQWLWWGLITAGLLIGAAAIYYAYYLRYRANIAAGYKARWVATGIFASGRTLESVEQQEMFDKRLNQIKVEIDRDAKKVTASAFGLARRSAVFYPGLGAVLMGGNGHLAPHLQYFKHSYCAHPDPETPWPQGNGLSPVMPGVEQVRLQAALSEAFRRQEQEEINPRAIVAVYKGKLVAERYAKGFGPGMGLAGWSMTKSVLSALAGIAVKKGILKVGEPAPLKTWQRPGDPRANITLEHLLHMSSGLCFSERYGESFSDVAQMLYGSTNTAGLAMHKEMCADPGECFEYSSGASNIIAFILRQALGDDQAYLDFAHKELFCPLSMSSALLAPDASGTLVGSTNMLATARDWARIGQLYLEDGVWQGTRILPKGWVDYTRTPAPASRGRYGAHWWLNRYPQGGRGKAQMPDLPGDAYFAYGFGGQFLTLVPSKNLVVVGLRFYRASDQKVMALQNKLVAGVIAGLPE